jgi:hypothetical protein
LDWPEDIPFDRLPNQFALKATAGCGWNILCPDRSKLNIPQSIELLRGWQKTNFFYQCREWQYKPLRSRIIAERLMIDPQHPDRSPPDIKVFCFHGEPRVIGISTDRRGDTRHDFFDCQWNPVDYGITTKPRCEIPPQKPGDLARMLEIARKLSAGFPFVRVDLYRHDNRIIFGEMTFSPSAGNMQLAAPGADELWGSWLTLPN